MSSGPSVAQNKYGSTLLDIYIDRIVGFENELRDLPRWRFLARWKAEGNLALYERLYGELVESYEESRRAA